MGGIIFLAYWGGTVTAIPVCLGLWAALRDSGCERLAVPTALLGLAIVAELAGQRLNHAAHMDARVGFTMASCFATSYLLGALLRRLAGWRIGPTSDSRSRFRLSRMFVWIAVLASQLAAVTWICRGKEVQLFAGEIPTVALGGAIMAATASIVVIPSIGSVMAKSRLRHVLILGLVLLAFTVIAIVGVFIGEEFQYRCASHRM